MVGFSEDLKPEELRPARYFGRDFVIWRSAAGELRVFDAHCPHLGAHLGHGGKVEGESIRCPFHAWEFDGPQHRDMTGAKPHGKARDAGALESE